MNRPLATFSLTLNEAAQLVGAEFTSSEDIVITGISHRDSDIQAGDIFLAVPGTKKHGAEFIAAAIKRRAVAVLTDRDGAKFAGNLPVLIVKDVRTAGALIASALFKNPTRDVQTIGITGTNGKTTVSLLLHQIFEAAGRDSGLIGTIGVQIGTEALASSRTTPEASDLQALAATMRERHMRQIIMEVSSHAISLKRIKGSHFSIVGFTNLSQDHLDFHGDMESYFKVKAQLFTHEYAELGFINIDNKFGARLSQESDIPTISLSRTNQSAQWHFTETFSKLSGTELRIRGTGGILIESRTKLIGGYNLDNLLMAVAIAFECGIDAVELAAIIPSLRGAPGRLEAVSLGQEFTALVDYAHSPDAVSNVLAAAREFTEGKIIAVLGCGGDRDKGKRPLMGSALVAGSDVAIFTSDNPRSENPKIILTEMTSHTSVTEPSRVIEDRSLAIKYAVSLAQSGDTVLVLGKGHEVGQEINGEITAFDDVLHLAQSIEGRK